MAHRLTRIKQRGKGRQVRRYTAHGIQQPLHRRRDAHGIQTTATPAERCPRDTNDRYTGGETPTGYNDRYTGGETPTGYNARHTLPKGGILQTGEVRGPSYATQGGILQTGEVRRPSYATQGGILQTGKVRGPSYSTQGGILQPTRILQHQTTVRRYPERVQSKPIKAGGSLEK